MNLASACIDRQVIKFGRLQDELAEWRSKCGESKCFCSSADKNAIDFDTLWDEITYKRNREANKCG